MTAWSWLLRNKTRRLEGRLRARSWHALGWVRAGRRVQIGRGCRLRAEPGGTIHLADGVEIDDGVTLAVTSRGRIEIGSNSFVGHHATLAARDRLVIGPRTLIAELVSLRDHDHDPDRPPSSGDMISTPVTIGADVWIASKATVTRGVHVGDRAVVAAGAVVRSEVQPGEIVGGVPARHLRWVAGFERSPGASSADPR